MAKFIVIFIIFGTAFALFAKYKHFILPEGKQIQSILKGKQAETTMPRVAVYPAQTESGGGQPVAPSAPVAVNDSVNSVKIVRIGVVTWGGYAGGQYFNNGFAATKNSRFYTEFGFMVEFIVLDDFIQSRNAWKSGRVDLLWATVDAFPSEADALKEYSPQFALQADWSRGGDVILGMNDIKTMKDFLKPGNTIAVALGTPSHSFFLCMLQADEIEYADVKKAGNIVEVDSAIVAAQYYKTGKTRAAVVWSPDDEDCKNNRPGTYFIKTTGTATHIVADGFFGKRAFIDANPDIIDGLYIGWMKGAAEINSNPAAKTKASQILADGLNIGEEDALKAINKVRLVTHGDNVNFFGLNPNYRGVTGQDLYEKMARIYNAINLAPDVVPTWRSVNYTGAIRRASAVLTGPEQAAEGAMEFAKPTRVDVETQAVASKSLQITFATGSAVLDQNATILIDMAFVDTLKRFAGSRVRLIGYTDSTGNLDKNIELSEKRAESVRNYLVNKYGFDENRFVVIGKGPNEPIASNATEEGRAKNRRTELQLL